MPKRFDVVSCKEAADEQHKLKASSPAAAFQPVGVACKQSAAAHCDSRQVVSAARSCHSNATTVSKSLAQMSLLPDEPPCVTFVPAFSSLHSSSAFLMASCEKEKERRMKQSGAHSPRLPDPSLSDKNRRSQLALHSRPRRASHSPWWPGRGAPVGRAWALHSIPSDGIGERQASVGLVS
eukprot:1160534-Pelagomonas_calceolata.AAC.24